jgi:hypothetical protein
MSSSQFEVSGIGALWDAIAWRRIHLGLFVHHVDGLPLEDRLLFDDPVHEVFGVASREWQSFYHFSVGGPVEDVPLTTLPASGPEHER